MPQTIRHLRSTTAGAAPSSLLSGQIGVNHTDGRLYYRSAGGSPIFRSLRDCGTLIAKGTITANTANVTFNVDPAVIGIMKMFLLRLNSGIGSSNMYPMMRFGSASGIKSGSSDYAYGYLGPGSSAVFDTGQIADSILGICDVATTGSPWQVEVLISTNDPTPTLFRSAVWQSAAHTASAGWFKSTGNGWINSDIDLTQIQILPNTGNFNKLKYCLIGFT